MVHGTAPARAVPSRLRPREFAGDASGTPRPSPTLDAAADRNPVINVLRSTRHAHRHLPVTRHLQPVRHAGPEFEHPSDSASWLSCTEHYEPAHRLPETAGSAEGWADRWTVERLDQRDGRLTATVAQTRPEHFRAAESVRRMTNRHQQPNRSGVEYLAATGRHHSFESLNEKGVLGVVDFARPLDVVSQPLRLHWHDGDRRRSHVPDFLVVERHGTTVVNFKEKPATKPEDEENFAAMTAVAARLGWRHVVVTGLARPQATVVNMLASARGELHDPLGLRDELRQSLATGPGTFGRLVAATPAPALARAVLLSMLWRGEAAVDLACRLSDASTVRLGGGRR